MKVSSIWRKFTIVVLTLALIVPINLLNLITVNANTSNVPSQTIYLSDLNWESATHGDFTTTYTVQKDKEFESGNKGGNRKISLKINELETREFDKGISTVASSRIVYDIEDKGYTAFSTFVGVDAVTMNDYLNSSGELREGVVESITISIDNQIVFQKVQVTPDLNAEWVDVQIPSTAKELILESSAGAIYWADVVDFADAKFTLSSEPGPGVDPAPATRLIRYEAEDAIHNTNREANGNASGGFVLGNFDHAVGRFAEFNSIYVPSTGLYNVNLGYASPNGAEYTLTVNGTTTNNSVTSTGNWNTYAQQSVSIQLNEGVNSIKFSSITGTVMDVDYLEVEGAIDRPLPSNWTYVNENQASITYTGNWNTIQKSASREGSSKQSSTVGASAEFTFTGTGVQWFGKLDPNFGLVNLYVDGSLVKQENLKRTFVNYQNSIYSIIGLSEGTHTFKIEYTGDATNNGIGIDVDGFAYTTETGAIIPDTFTVFPKLTRLQQGQNLQLTASAMLANSHVFTQGVVYQSSNANVATVDSSTGLVTAVADGEATITASYGTFIDTSQVNVKTWAEGEKRIQVSNDHPLLIVPLYGKLYDPVASQFQWEDTLLGRWNSIPDDIKPYTIIEIHSGGIGIGNEAHIKAFYEQQLEIAEANNIPVALLTITAGNAQVYTGTYYLDAEWAQEMYDKYSVLVGLMSSENYWIYGDHIANKAAEYINVSAENGGYFIWSEQNPNRVVERAVANTNFQQAMKQNSDSFIFTFKTTPASTGTAPETSSYMAGLWMTDYVGQWGGLIDTWSWWERKNWKLFEQSTLPGGGGGGEEARTVATVPESMLAIEMMNVYLSGGTVYNFEHPAYTTGVEDQNTPAFEHAIVDFLRYAINNPAPTKDEVISQTNIVVHDNIGNVGGNNFYKGLNSENPNFSTYTTGRYGIIPVVPASIPRADVVAAFNNATILSGSSSHLATKQSKIDFFNSVYPALYTGDAFAQKLDNRWFVYNSNVNVDVDQQASLPLGQSNVTISTVIEPHTYLVLDEQTNGFDVKLNNYRVDKDSIWAGYTSSTQRWNTDVNNHLQNWILSSYMVNPADDVMRTTVIRVSNQTAAPIISDITGLANQYEQPIVAYNAATGVATITINSNGYMDFSVTLSESHNMVLTNVAHNSTVTVHKNPNPDRPNTMLVDGIKHTNNYAEVGKDLVQNAADPYYIQLDLGQSYSIEKLNLWRYFQDGRSYNNTVILISEDTQFTASDVVYNADTTNYFGFGAGTEATYTETSSGKEIVLSSPVSGRYVRLLNNGSSVGLGGHYVELEVWALQSIAPNPATTIPFANAEQPLELGDIFTAPGKQKGETHPDVLYFENGWNGYKYWMATTPNQNGNSQYENPSLLVSNDNITWVTPPGITNPLTNVLREPDGFHNCDADLVYNPEDDSLYLYYNWAKDSPSYGGNGFQPSEIRLFIISKGTNGLSVSTPNYETVVTSTYRYDALSPAVVINPNGVWSMYTVNTGDRGYNNQSNRIDYRLSHDGIHWSDPISLADTFKVEGHQIWHVDVKYIPEKNEYWAILPAYPNGGSSAQTYLFFAKSTDGKVWTTYNKKIMDVAPGKWDSSFIYRSTFTYDQATDMVRVWYGGGTNGVINGWRTGYTENTYTNLMTYLGAGNIPTIPAPVDPVIPTVPTEPELENVARYAGVSVFINKGINPDRPAHMLVDGVIGSSSSNNYAEMGMDMLQNAADPYYMQVDLQNTYSVEKLNLWRYFNDARQYNNTIIFVSNDTIFTADDIVYNADTTNFFGYGVGTDVVYSETVNGKEIILDEPTNGRYIRILNNGSSVGRGGHYVELQVWAKPLVVTGTWHDVGSLSNNIVYDEGWSPIVNEGIYISSTRNAKASLTFYGTGIRWIGQKDVNFGIADVYLDNVKVATVDTYGRGADARFGYVHYENTDLPVGVHTLSIVPTGNKNASSSDSIVDIEKLQVFFDDDETINVEQLTVSPLTLRLFTEETYQLIGQAQPYNANNRIINWSSSNPNVALVSSTGLITAGLEAGTATITASIPGINQTQTVTVTVVEFGEAAPMRMPVDEENILFLHHLYRQFNSNLPGPLQGGKSIQSFWESIENGDINGGGIRSDLAINQAIIIHASGEVKGYPETLAWYEERFVETLNNTPADPSDDIPFFIMVSNSGTSGGGVYNPPSVEWTENIYQQYPNMRGIVFSENHNATASWEITARSEYMKEQVILAAQYGGYVVYSDMNDNGDYVERVLDHAELFRILQAYKQNFIILAKTTSAWSSVSYNSHESVALGAWLSDIAGNWGSLIDSWMWFIEGFGPLYGNETFSVTGGAEEVRGAFTFPELFFPIRMIQQARIGATVFSYEHPDYATSIAVKDEQNIHRNLFTPVFTDGIAKAMEYMKDYDISTKEEVIERTKFAYSAANGSLNSLAQSSAGNLLNPLYGDKNYNTYNNTTMMMYFTGRYGTIPSLPKLAPQSVKEQFDTVFTRNDVISQLVNQAGIKAYFDNLYPQTYTGDAYAHELNNTWFLYNNNWNIDSRVPAELDAQQQATIVLDNNDLTANVSFATYTYLLIDDKTEGQLGFNFNNLLIDKNDIWVGYVRGNGRPGDGSTWHWDSDNDTQFYNYLKDEYIPELTRNDDRYRSATIVLTGYTSEPTLIITQGLTNNDQTTQYTTPVTTWDAETGTYTIQLSANGWLDFIVKEVDEETEEPVDPVDPGETPELKNNVLLGSSSDEVIAGKKFELVVSVDKLTAPFTMFQAVVHYDPTKVKFTTAGKRGNEKLAPSSISTLSSNLVIVETRVKPEEGKIIVSLASKGRQHDIEDGPIIKLKAELKDSVRNGETVIYLDDVIVTKDGNDMLLDATNGSVTIVTKSKTNPGNGNGNGPGNGNGNGPGNGNGNGPGNGNGNGPGNGNGNSGKGNK